MRNVISLSKHKKSVQKRKARAQADENAIKFGLPKHLRSVIDANNNSQEKKLSLLKLSPSSLTSKNDEQK